MSADDPAGPDDQAPDGAEQGRWLVRSGGDMGLSLGERVSGYFHRLTWRTPLHAMRLRGQYPLKLTAVPNDPLPGDAARGRGILAGSLTVAGITLPLAGFDYQTDRLVAPLSDYLQRFDWLRDVAASAPRATAAPAAESLMRRWLAAHGETIGQASWAPVACGWRILNWAAHAPLILSSTDLVYRSAVLNSLARQARHLDRGADRAPQGVERIVAWAGVVVAGLLIPGGQPRRNFGEAQLVKAIGGGFSADGGIVNRAPADQMEACLALAMLKQVYDVQRQEPPVAVSDMLTSAVAALQGLIMGDGALSSWQGSGPVPTGQVERYVAATGVRTRPLRQARDWGYQRMVGGPTVVVVDAGAPPASRLQASGCASTAAFELSDGPARLIVNCGGAQGMSVLPAALVRGLRTTAAHSTLVIDHANSTAILPDGRLGAGVNAIELDRQELEGGSRIDMSHDGYVRRYGFIHKRTLALSLTGKELRGEDILLPGQRRRRSGSAPFTVRFHVAPGVEITPTADGQAALLRIPQGPLWQFRCRGGTLSIEESIWIDGGGIPRTTAQFVVNGEATAGGATVSWLLKRAG